MKKIYLILIIIALFSIKSTGQNCPHVSIIGSPTIYIEYECITEEYTYDVEMPVFLISDLVEDTEYCFDYDSESTLFDGYIYEPWPIEFDTTCVGGCWAGTDCGVWPESEISTDTILLRFYGYYDDLDRGTEYPSFGICINYPLDDRPPWPYGDFKYVGIHVTSSMYVSGPKLACSNPVSFDLKEMPLSYASATWVIKQGAITKASGIGTTATANNLSNGNGEVKFTVQFECGLKSLTFSKEFHFGPYSSSDYEITGPSSAPCESWVSYSIPQLEGVTSINWDWPQEWTYHSGQGTRYLALITGQYSGVVLVGVNNECGQSGSYAYKYTSIYGYCGYGFSYYPSPASNEITITINEPETIDKVDNELIANVLSEDEITYTIRIYNRLGSLVSTSFRKGKSFNIPLHNLRDGTYIVEVSDGKNSYREQLIIKHD